MSFSFPPSFPLPSFHLSCFLPSLLCQHVKFLGGSVISRLAYAKRREREREKGEEGREARGGSVVLCSLV